MSDITVVIKTMSRPSLTQAIESCLRERLAVIAVADGHPFPPKTLELAERRAPAVRLVRLGRVWGQYGAMAFNVGCMLAESVYALMLDDDDELIEGARSILYERISGQPSVDVWIPGLRYNDDTEVCLQPGLKPGNVACPMLKTEVMTRCPLLHVQADPNLQDFHHIQRCDREGYNVGWIGKSVILVRPKLSGKAGRGQK